MTPDPVDGLLHRLRSDMPVNVVLMLLLVEANSSGAAAFAIARVRADRPDLAARAAVVERLFAAHPDAWEVVHTAAQAMDHTPALASPEAALAHWREGFDRLAATSPEAGVALYALGDPVLLAEATAEVLEVLRGWGFLGRTRDALDLGCGIGRFAEALAPHMHSVLGLDLSTGMIEEARRRARHANVHFATGTGRNLDGVADACLDFVLAGDVFPYLVAAGLAAVHVAEMARVLRPGGAAVILNYSYRGDPTGDRADLDVAAAANGLTLERAGERPFRLWDAVAFVLRLPP